MILVLDLDRTLNRLYPAWVRSIRDLAPAQLRAENGRAFWDWIITHLSSIEYPPHEGALKAVQALCSEASAVVINTGRPEALRAVSERWVRRFLRVDGIWMRANDDFRPTAEVKRDNLCELLQIHRQEEIFAFDDNQAALRTYREAGANALWAPRCWEGLLAALESRAAHESAASVLRRHAAALLEHPCEIQAVDHQDARGRAHLEAQDGNGAQSDLDAQGEIDWNSEAVGNDGSNYVRVSNDRD